MAMKEIGRPALPEQALQGYRNQGPARSHDKAAAAGQGKAAQSTNQPDRLELSPQARQLEQRQSVMEQARRALDQEPEVRADRVAAARRHLAEGRHHSSEVQQELAARLGKVLKQLDDLIG